MTSNNTVGLILKTLVLGSVLLAMCDAQFDIAKRMPNALHHAAIRKLKEAYLNKLLQRSTAKRRERGHLTDAGYGSRVSAAANVAKASLVRDDLFGIFGPGRRKRHISVDPNTQTHYNKHNFHSYSDTFGTLSNSYV